MTSQQTWQERIDTLAYGEVQPLLFATDVERCERVVVHVVLIDPADDIHPSGPSSTGPVFSREFDGPISPTDDQVMGMRRETIAQFSLKLRELLSEPHS